MTTILSIGDKLYADRRSTFEGGFLSHALKMEGRKNIRTDFSKKIFVVSNGILLKPTEDCRVFGFKDPTEIPIVKAFCAAGDTGIIGVVENAVRIYADDEGNHQLDTLLRMIGSSRLDILQTFKLFAVLSDGRTVELELKKDRQDGTAVVHGKLNETGRICMLGSGSRYWHKEMKYGPEHAKDLFVACCYLDENSSINYSVFDIVTDKLTFHTPTDEEIQKAMNNVGLGGLWMGPKKVLDFSDKK